MNYLLTESILIRIEAALQQYLQTSLTQVRAVKDLLREYPFGDQTIPPATYVGSLPDLSLSPNLADKITLGSLSGYLILTLAFVADDAGWTITEDLDVYEQLEKISYGNWTIARLEYALAIYDIARDAATSYHISLKDPVLDWQEIPDQLQALNRWQQVINHFNAAITDVKFCIRNIDTTIDNAPLKPRF